MEADYKNWMPKGMILGCAAGSVACVGFRVLAHGLMDGGNLRTAVMIAADVGVAAGACLTAWCISLYKAFGCHGTWPAVSESR